MLLLLLPLFLSSSSSLLLLLLLSLSAAAVVVATAEAADVVVIVVVAEGEGGWGVGGGGRSTSCTSSRGSSYSSMLSVRFYCASCCTAPRWAVSPCAGPRCFAHPTFLKRKGNTPTLRKMNGCDVASGTLHDQGPVSWRPTTVKWRQSSQSNRNSTIGARQTEYHEAIRVPSSANVQSHLTLSFADDGKASWGLVCRVPMVEWRLDCEDCHRLTVVGLHDTGPQIPLWWPGDGASAPRAAHRWSLPSVTSRPPRWPIGQGVRLERGRPGGRYHGGRRPSNDDSLQSPAVIPPSALDKPSQRNNSQRKEARLHPRLECTAARTSQYCQQTQREDGIPPDRWKYSCLQQSQSRIYQTEAPTDTCCLAWKNVFPSTWKKIPASCGSSLSC